jgi:hypothetical protein
VLLRAIVAAVVVTSCAPAMAREFPVIPQPLVLRLRGRIAPARAAARAQSPDVVGLRLGNETRWLAVDEAVTVPDHALSGRGVLDSLQPFQSTLVVAGASDLRARLAEASIGEIVTVEGVVDRGSRTYLLRDVQMPRPSTPP